MIKRVKRFGGGDQVRGEGVEGRRQVVAWHAPPALGGRGNKEGPVERAGRKEFSASGSRTMAQLGLQAS